MTAGEHTAGVRRRRRCRNGVGMLDPLAHDLLEGGGQPGSRHRGVGGPGVRAQLQGDRRDQLCGHRGVSRHGDVAGGEAEVDEDVRAVVVPPDRHQAGQERGPEAEFRLGAGVDPPGHPLLLHVPRGGRRVEGARQSQVAGLVVDRHGIGHGNLGQPGQRPQDGVEPPGPMLVGAHPQKALELRGVIAGPCTRPLPTTARQHRQERGRQQRSDGRRLCGQDLLAAGRVVDHVAPRLVRRLIHGGRRRGIHVRYGDDPVDVRGGLRHGQEPSGLDETGQLQRPAVVLDPADIEIVDLGVRPAVPEVALGDVPEVVVVPALRRLDDVDPLADQLRTGLLVELGVAEHVAHVLLALRTAVGCAGARSGRPGIGGGFLGAGRIHLLGDGRRRRGALRHRRRRRYGRADRAHQQGRDDQPTGEPLDSAGQRHVHRHAPAPQGGDGLDGRAYGELQPGEPHHPHQKRQERLQRDRARQYGDVQIMGQGRQPHRHDEQCGHADDEEQKQESGEQGSPHRWLGTGCGGEEALRSGGVLGCHAHRSPSL